MCGTARPLARGIGGRHPPAPPHSSFRLGLQAAMPPTRNPKPPLALAHTPNHINHLESCTLGWCAPPALAIHSAALDSSHMAATLPPQKNKNTQKHTPTPQPPLTDAGALQEYFEEGNKVRAHAAAAAAPAKDSSLDRQNQLVKMAELHRWRSSGSCPCDACAV